MTSPADTAAHRPACFDAEAPLAMLCPWCRSVLRAVAAWLRTQPIPQPGE